MQCNYSGNGNSGDKELHAKAQLVTKARKAKSEINADHC